MRRWDLTESIGDHFAIHVNQTLLGCLKFLPWYMSISVGLPSDGEG